MARHQHECPACGEAVPSLFGALLHCDPYEPIDDLNDDDTITRSTN